MKQLPISQKQFDVFAKDQDLQLSRKMMNFIKGGDGGGNDEYPIPPPPPPPGG